jgi:hypothetical protein
MTSAFSQAYTSQEKGVLMAQALLLLLSLVKMPEPLLYERQN